MRKEQNKVRLLDGTEVNAMKVTELVHCGDTFPLPPVISALTSSFFTFTTITILSLKCFRVGL